MKKVVVFDLDDTLVDTSHRKNILDKIDNIVVDEGLEEGSKEYKKAINEEKSKIWEEFSLACDDDKPVKSMIEKLKSYRRKGYSIYAFSGRSSIAEEKTVDFFKKMNIEFDLLKMRRPEQKMPSHYLKNAWVKKYIIEKGDEMVNLFDDSEKVVDYLKEKGHTATLVDDAMRQERKRGVKP
mgnify:CR=1 FL=1